MKTILLAFALLVTGLVSTGRSAPPGPPPRAIAIGHPSFPHPHFPRPGLPHPNYNWNHTYWKVHRYGWWHHRRGYWTVRRGEHIFINRD